MLVSLLIVPLIGCLYLITTFNLFLMFILVFLSSGILSYLGIYYSIFNRIPINNSPQPTNNTSLVLVLVQSSGMSSKIKDPINYLHNNSFEEIKNITESIKASSPLEDEINTHVGNVLYLLEMDLTLSLIMIGLVLFIVYVFTIRLFLEKHTNFNFILKFPFGKTLHIILNKVFSFTKNSSNIWFYFMFFSLFTSLLSSTYCIYICILILKMIPS